MTEKYYKTEIILDDLQNNPKCVHGPTILFKDFIQGRERHYFSCSAYRDKKYCDFHLDNTDKITQGKIFKWREKEKEFMEGKDDHMKLYQPMKDFKVSGAIEGIFCQTCGKVINKEDLLHTNHNITNFTSEQINNVSSIIQGKTDNKKEAQYFFNKKSKNYIIDCIRSVGSSHLLCVGTPTIFDQVNNINKLLLDFDSRYLGLHRPSDFIWFNMLNFHFFHNNKIILETFLSAATHVSLVLDPPFGARPELIQRSLECIKRCLPNNVEISIFWIFPYFMEKKLQIDDINMKMTKYRVNYTNHKGFSGESNGRKFGSPVRIFTNVDLKSLPVPKNEDYRMCEKCKYFVSGEDVHCNICNTCPSKDGRPYSHCSICSRCVKITYTHCPHCQRCHLPSSCNSKQEQPRGLQLDKKNNFQHIRAEKRRSNSLTRMKNTKKHKRKRKK